MSEKDEQGLVHQPNALPAPLYTGKQMADSLRQYRELQRGLDESMPDQLMELSGKQFRKKGYWRAVNVAFGLTVRPIAEERVVAGLFEDGHENFGYNVTYEAIAPNGRSATGDGSCFAVEKAPKFKCPHPQNNNPKRAVHWPPESCPQYDPNHMWRRLVPNASEHNVRSHAHTRAFNRAVSNLVGFGEVSAEEIGDQPLDAPVVSSEPIPAGRGATQSAQPAQGAPNPRQHPTQRQAAAQAPLQPTQNDGLGESELPPEDVNPQTGEWIPPQQGARPLGNKPAAQPRQQPAQQQAQPASQVQPTGTGPVISQAQDRRFFALAMSAGWDPNDLRAALKEVWGYDRSDEIHKSAYNRVVSWVQNGPPR